MASAVLIHLICLLKLLYSFFRRFQREIKLEEKEISLLELKRKVATQYKAMQWKSPKKKRRLSIGDEH